MISEPQPEAIPRLSRPVVRVVINQQLLDCMFREGYISRAGIKCIHGIPNNARLVGMAQDTERQAVCFFYEHASFTPVPYGDVIPSFDVQLAEIGEQ